MFMDAGVLFEFTQRTIDSRRFSYRVWRQVLKHPMGNFVAAIVRYHKIGIRSNIIETRKTVPHNLRHACRRIEHIIVAGCGGWQ